MTISTHKRTCTSRGFTLLELMTTLTLAAILLGIAIPSFRGMSAGNRIVTQANDLVGAINYARSEAIMRNGNMTFCRATTATTTNCAPSLAAWTNWIVRDAAGAVVRRGTINTYDGTITLNSDFSLDAITFGADGLARTGGVPVSDSTITVCTTAITADNIRTLKVGAGSRLSTTKSTGTC